MWDYRKWKLLRLFHLISKKKYKKKTAKYTEEYKAIMRSKLFDAKWYLKHNPDVKKVGVDPIQHYLEQGWKEGRKCTPYFDGKQYLKMYPDIAATGINPLVHYLIHGQKEGRRFLSDKKNDYSLSVLQKIYFVCSSILGKVVYRSAIKKNKDAKILVCLHLYYMEAWPAIKKYLSNLSPYKYDLIITYVSNHYDVKTLEKIKIFNPQAKFHEYPNQGFDIGSFIDILTKIDLRKYDIIYKLHSKGTRRSSIFIYHQIFKYKDWFLNLYNGILGGFSVHEAIDTLKNKKEVGVVAAKNLIIEDPKHKNYFTHKYAKKLNIKIPENYHFVAGTCFACKAKALSDLQKLKLNIADFETTTRGEFSLAHGMERIICAMIESQGYKLQGINTSHPQYFEELSQKEKVSSLRLLDDQRFSLDYDFFYKVLEGRKIFSYELEKLKIKDINRRWFDRKIYSIKETSAYAYLQGDVKRYEEYCEINAQKSKFNMNKVRFDKLSTSVRRSFNFKMMPVLDGANNIIQDGQHRLAILLDKYGEDYEVQCLKVYYKERPKEVPIKFSKKL